MNGTFIDVGAVIIGGLIGYFTNSKVISTEFQEKVMQALAICAFLIGIDGAMSVTNPIICIISIVAGASIGNVLSLEDRLVWSLNKLSRLFAKTNVSDHFVEGFISYSLLSITGSMAIVGPISNCLTGDISTLMTKAVLDFICAILFGLTFGLSIVFTAVLIFAYQGMFALLALVIAPLITDAVIGDMSCIGSLLIFLLGLNLIKATNVKTMNLTPAIFLPILLHWLIG